MAAVADWITINDFSPGMFQDYHQASTGNNTAMPQNGAATVADTWRCTADKARALIPLPKRAVTFSKAVPFMDFAGSTAGFAASTPKAVLLDALVMSPVTATVSANPNAESFPSVVFLLYCLQYDPTPGTNYRQYVVGKTIPLFAGAPTAFDFVFSRGTAFNTGIYSSGCMDRTRSSAVFGTYTPDQYVTAVVGSFSIDSSGAPPVVGTGAMSPGEQTLTNFDTVVSLNSGAPAAILFGATIFSTPNISANTPPFAVPTPSVGTFNVPSVHTSFPLMVAHQGRAVFARRNPSSFYGPTVGFYYSDFLSYTQPGDFSALGEDAIFGEESPSPIGALVSMSANELLIVKHSGGGTLVRGDIANPQVLRLPLIHSTGGYTTRAVATPAGVFYGTRDGVVRWSGGDTSDLVSKQLDGAFWDPHPITEPMEGNRGRFGFQHPWVFVPNGYLLDLDAGGWWRLEDPAVVPNGYSAYDVDSRNNVYAFPYKVQGTGSQVWWDTYNPAVLASSYSWKSQPLVETREREDNFAELEIVTQRMPNGFVSGVATIVATLTGYRADGSTVSATNTFTLTNNDGVQAMIQAVNVNFTARFVQIKLVVDSGNTSMPAPKIMSVRLGRRPGPRPPRT